MLGTKRFTNLSEATELIPAISFLSPFQVGFCHSLGEYHLKKTFPIGFPSLEFQAFLVTLFPAYSLESGCLP